MLLFLCLTEISMVTKNWLDSWRHSLNLNEHGGCWFRHVFLHLSGMSTISTRIFLTLISISYFFVKDLLCLVEVIPEREFFKYLRRKSDFSVK